MARESVALLSCLGVVVLAAVAGCPNVDNGSDCSTDQECGNGKACVNGSCTARGSSSSSGGLQPCNTASDCGPNQVCSASNTCEDQPTGTLCSMTADCPDAQYCNTATAECAWLEQGACREPSQCSASMPRCSAPAGGVGRCLQCLVSADCNGGTCTAQGTCTAPTSSSGASSSSGGSNSSSAEAPDAGAEPDAGTPEPAAYVFAHTSTALYRMDADTLEASEMGAFIFQDEDGAPLREQTMTDFAVDSLGLMVGCGSHALFRIDSTTLHARRVALLEEDYVGLTFVPVGVMDATREVLVGATSSNGALYRINPDTGDTMQIGSYGGDWLTSGDIVAIKDDAMYGTLRKANGTQDYLARIDTLYGTATIIGNGIGSTRLFGLGYWGGTLYGFNAAGDVVAIDRVTGTGTVINHLPISWWGAGVTTLAKTH